MSNSIRKNLSVNEENMDILKYLNSHIDYASMEEQKEFDSIEIDLDNLDGEEIPIN